MSNCDLNGSHVDNVADELSKSLSCLSLNQSCKVKVNSDQHWFQTLSLCEQCTPSWFGIEFPKECYEDYKCVDSGSYSHVVKAFNRGPKRIRVVFKIMNVIQRATIDHFSQCSFKGVALFSDVYQEIAISKLLSSLHQGVSFNGSIFQTHIFCRVYNIKVCQGEIPEYLFTKEQNEKRLQIASTDLYNQFGILREHVVILMKFGGNTLWDAMHSGQLTPDQLLSVCRQVIFSLAIAEVAFEFEHRDLHVGNVLVRRTNKQDIVFKLRSVEYRLPSFGVQACIIDTTFSRMANGNSVYFIDLTKRLKRTFRKENLEEHEIVYQQMYRLINDRWNEWFPQTNILWLHYFFVEVRACCAFRQFASPQQDEQLLAFISSVTKFRTVFDFTFSILRYLN